MKNLQFILCSALMSISVAGVAADKEAFSSSDIFHLEYATNPRIAPGGNAVVYERKSMDVMADSRRTNIWSVDLDGTNHRPIFSGKAHYSMPRFSPDGTRMAYVSSNEGKAQIYIKWLDTGQTARVTDVQFAPSRLSWSPDSQTIAFTMFVPAKPVSLYSLPSKPKGAKWAKNATVVDKVTYRHDGRRGLLPEGFVHVFTVPADGGTPRQITSGNFQYGSALGWLKDNSGIIFSANLNDNWELDPVESDIYSINLQSGDLVRLTDRKGPDSSPRISPNGAQIAYLGFDDKLLSNQNVSLYVMAVDGSGARLLTADLDRSVNDVQWAADGKGLYYSYDNEGKHFAAYVTLTGGGRVITDKIGGTELGRPYTSGGFRVVPDGRMIFTQSRTDRPADLAIIDRIGRTVQLTHLNEDLLGHKTLAPVEELNLTSSLDGRPLQAWLVKPAGFEAGKKYPLILEIHGGPHAAYGPHFSAEAQTYAAAGYMVLFVNPRGSTSYGMEFANLIHHNYPADDYNDLMDAVDAVVASGATSEDQLYVTGGSGGGTLAAWIIGKTDRFRAAVVVKPVIHWASFVLTADFGNFFAKYWFGTMPWEDPTGYWERSPLSLVGNVNTPTMLLTGERDYRTPMPETEQYYQALKLRGIDSVMVRVSDAGHGIDARPSNLARKVGNILAWFKKYAPPEE